MIRWQLRLNTGSQE
uniref:Uncharacterized protein n=1 Tax=Anguilla anguilla TaxID=7936 RepID=A0A0E9RYG0_ANGAN